MENKIIIFGIAPGVYEEILSVALVPRRLGMKIHYMAVGMDAIGKVPWNLKYVVSNHVEDLPAIVEKMKGQASKYQIVCPYKTELVDIVFDPPYEGPSGSSAIVGALAALRLGYEKIILCGIHLTGNAFEGNSYEAFRPGWTYHKDKFVGKVKSTGGWTQELLGAPTREWLEY